METNHPVTAGSRVAGALNVVSVPAEPRINDIEPLREWPPTDPDDLLMVIQAIYPPGSRRIVDHLRASKGQSLDELAANSKLSFGSTCHHLRELYRAGVAMPDETHTDDQGRPWWRLVKGTLWWNPNEFPVGSQLRERFDAATLANVRHQYKSITEFLRTEPANTVWSDMSSVSESLTMATAAEMEELMVVVNDAVDEWMENRTVAEDDGQERRPIRVTTWIHPIA